MTLSETRRENQYFLLHQSSGDMDYDRGHTQRVLTRESIWTLMDICARQSKLLRR
jgi:hypothetical protein